MTTEQLDLAMSKAKIGDAFMTEDGIWHEIVDAIMLNYHEYSHLDRRNNLELKCKREIKHLYFYRGKRIVYFKAAEEVEK